MIMRRAHPLGEHSPTCIDAARGKAICGPTADCVRIRQGATVRFAPHSSFYTLLALTAGGARAPLRSASSMSADTGTLDECLQFADDATTEQEHTQHKDHTHDHRYPRTDRIGKLGLQGHDGGRTDQRT